uniref:Ribosomal protein S3 n=1 Tax=Colletotrichum lindemuthianum TaxID=290576 RepID=A0A2D2AJ29_COLLN|nr:ribosomal protein S3 [Colletotrichum lindemuthianum]
MQNLPIDNINANKVIKSYFNLHFADNKFIGSKYISPKNRSLFLKKIFVSKIETKHTNSKIIITLYTINTEKNIVSKNYKKCSIFWENKLLNSFKKGWKKKIHEVSALIPKGQAKAHLAPVKNEELNASINNNASSIMNNQKKLLVSKYKLLTESLQCFNLYLRLYLSRHFKNSYFDKIDLLRKYQLNYYLNKLKFERNSYLAKLSTLLSKIFNNNIEFNIINLKSVSFNPDIFTEILSLKLRKPKPRGVINVINSLLKLAKLPVLNRIQEKASIIKSLDFTLWENVFSNFSLVSIMKENMVKASKQGSNSKALAALPSDENNISNIIFNSIKYKNLGGIRLEVKGRLTKRNRADRSVYKFKWKGGLKNIDSSFKSLSTVTYRGYYKPNVISSLSQSKRRVGSFAVKGWISGK